MEKVAAKERMTPEEIRALVAEGKVAICANKNHKCLDPQGVGSMLKTKINVNLGVSKDCKDYDIEMKKVMEAVNMGADAIMDLSSHGNTEPFRKKPAAEYRTADLKTLKQLPNETRQKITGCLRPTRQRRSVPPQYRGENRSFSWGHSPFSAQTFSSVCFSFRASGYCASTGRMQLAKKSSTCRGQQPI